MTTYTSLDEANRRIEELEGKLAHALEVGGARGRLLAEAETERNLLREQTRGRGEIIETLTAELVKARADGRAFAQVLLDTAGALKVVVPETIREAARAAGFDV